MYYYGEESSVLTNIIIFTHFEYFEYFEYFDKNIDDGKKGDM